MFTGGVILTPIRSTVLAQPVGWQGEGDTAVDTTPTGGNVGNQSTAGNVGNQPTGGNVTGTTKLANPLKGVTSISDFLIKIIDILLIFAVPVIVFFIIYSGFLFVTAAGSPEKIKKAREAFTWAVIGGVILLGANVIMTIVKNTVTSIQI